MVSDSPKVSVIIPCYNSAEFITDCIKSITSQNYSNIEIIVVDDGSTDTSVEKIEKFKEVKLIQQLNSGACVARNRGLKESSGEYIKFLDSDDYLEPEIIRRQVELAESLAADTIVYGNYFRLNSSNKVLETIELMQDQQTAQLFLKDILITTPLHRRYMLCAIDGFDEHFKNGQEWNLHIRLSSEGYIFYHHNDPVFTYRIHDSDHRISNRTDDILERVFYEVKKTKMTIERLGILSSGDLDAAVSMRYWWLARALLRSGKFKESHKLLSKAKSLSKNYDNYWPKYYKSLYPFFKFHMSEMILYPIYKFRNNKYID